ncbi:hypothetical protein LCGC14_1070020 [marine sediment metagenome]|uniref:Terminase large subunit gp17-like C-terminal domain-containing protein n=1 Tax=marine sediment metagenome TaxID=412755 RepID=A0A0F9N5N2_9ZZZZ
MTTDLMTADAPLYPEVKPDSVWAKTIFTPTYDPMEFVKTNFMIQAKNTKVVPFRPFRTQSLFESRLGLSNVTVKPRQVGMSSITLALMTAVSVTTPNIASLVITHRDDTTETMRDTLRNFVKWLNEYHGMGIVIGKDNSDAMEIVNTNSWFFFGSSTAPGVGRSRTIHMLLGSELAHWQGPDPGKELGGMTESMPDNGLIFLESTPNGAEGPFYKIYNSDADYTKHFFPWFIEPSRRIALHGHELTLTPQEQMLVTMHNLSHEQIAWRRWKWKKLEAEGMYFPQEYPEDDQSCFIAGLRSVFPAERMIQFMNYARVAMYADYPVPGDPWDPGGVLRVWEEPKPNARYVLAGDVGGGHVEGDLSYLIVRDAATGDHVASLFGHWTPERFADESVAVALKYNMGLLCHESNGLGIGTVNRCTNVLKYPNYYYELRGESRGATKPKPEDWQAGFNVSPVSRARNFSKVLDETTNGRFRSHDENLIRQMTAARYERVRISGGWGDKITLPQHVHDDGFMSYAQSCMLMEQPVIGPEQRALPRQAM